jgi:transcription antitermination factor NusG
MREYEAIAKKIQELQQQGKYEERNALVPVWREAYYKFDFGFKEGDEVEYYTSPNRKQIGKIIEIRPDQQVVFKNIIVPITLIKKISNERLEQLQEKQEQLTLF